jgi:tetratricopeptide (TPR) repeat protein
MEAVLLAAAMSPSGDLEGMSTSDIYNFGVNAFNDGNFATAVEAFGAVLAVEPHNRDAMHNRTNALYAGMTELRQEADGLSGEEAAAAEERLQVEAQQLVESAEYLLRYDPLNGDALKLQGEGYRVLKNQEMLLEVFTIITAAPLTLEVVGFEAGADGAVLTANATGRQPQSVDGSNIEATAVTITVEFMNEADEVVASQDVTIPILAPDATEEVVVEGQGSGIKWWRYSEAS